MKKFIVGAVVFVGLALVAGIIVAAPGDPVPPGSITPPGPGGSGCGGIGVAFDGTTIWYTCASESKIRKTDLTGADLGFIDTAEGLTPVAVDAIAWDPNEGKIWGGDLVDTDGVGGNDTCRIYSIDPATGAATTRFDRTDTGCTFGFFDGLTVDSVTDTLYYGPDVQKFIYHLNKDGTVGVNGLIDFETLTSGPDRCPGTEPFPDTDPVAGCNNSGLAIGLDGTLFAGTDGEGKIMLVDPVAPAFLSEFTAVSGRDEDLECGPVIDGKETILSRDFIFPGRIDILEAPEGTCVSPTGDTTPPEVACVETVNPAGKQKPQAPGTGQNEDGFYELLAKDNLDPNPVIYLHDMGTDNIPANADDTVFPGLPPIPGFPSGTKIKYTEANGATPSIKPMAGVINWKINGRGDAAVFAVDAAGNVSAPAFCLVPNPPK